MGSRQAVVVGAGPNGLAAAVELARRGYEVAVYEGAATIGGGARTLELIEPQHLHDVCSAAHPLGAASPFFRSLPLARYGLAWITPEIAVTHPFDGGRAVAMVRSLDETAGALGADGAAYRRLMEPIVARLDPILDGTLKPLTAGWRHPLVMPRFGLRAIRSVKSLAEHFETVEARALLAGLGAHSIAKLSAPATAGVALLLAAAGHTVGWPIARGGSQSIVDALGGYLTELGGTIVTGERIDSVDRFDQDTAVFLDTSPGDAIRIGGTRIESAAALAKWEHGPGSHKVDWILSDPIPWADALSARTATVHLGGTFEEIAAGESTIVDGAVASRPFAIITQPSLFDDTRAPQGRHIGWGYCHVPAGYEGDATAILEAQVERFAPGFRDTIVARHVHTAQGLERYNPNYVGGDIAGGALNLRQLLMRPRLAPNPYRIGKRLYLCSASTPPGAGVHGMCGSNAVAYAASDLD